MIAIIVLKGCPASYVAIVYEGDKLVAQLVGLSVATLKARVKAVYGIDCE